MCIILSGISYQYAGPSFKENYPYVTLPGLQIACIIYTFWMVGWGYLSFIKPNTGCTVSHAIFLMLSIIWNIAIGVFALVSYRVSFISTYLSCNSGYDGILALWNGVDTYLQQVNNVLCSPECPCYLTNISGFESNSTIAPYYNSWEKSSDPAASTAFPNCTDTIRYNTLNATRVADPNLEAHGGFDPANFANYMGFIENFFYCSGWCNTTYIDTSNNKTEVFYKYLFSDVNRGPPVHTGCLMPMINWLLPYLGAWGSLTMALSAIQIGIFIISMLQCQQKEEEEEDQIPHHNENAH